MQVFMPNDVVKSKLGTKFLVSKINNVETFRDKVMFHYDASNMCLSKLEPSLEVVGAKLCIASNMPSDDFVVVGDDQLNEDEKKLKAALMEHANAKA